MPSPPSFTLQFDPAMMAGLASRYPQAYDDEISGQIAPAVRARGYFTKPELVKLCEWKTPRSRPLVARNDEDEVREATRLALSTSSEALRIKIPMLLSGVGWPTASVVLHFCHQDRYPILDVRALEALGVTGVATFTVPLWTGYVAACRQLDDQTGLGMRAIDRALWQWSKDHSAGDDRP